VTNGNSSRGETKANSLNVSRIVDHYSFAVHATPVISPGEYHSTSKSTDSPSGGPAARIQRRRREGCTEHHATKMFQKEFCSLCIRHGIEIDERYVWDWTQYRSIRHYT
jgi:hypothetical protein